MARTAANATQLCKSCNCYSGAAEKGADTINHTVLQTLALLLTAVFLQIREHDVLSNSANPQLVQVGEQGGFSQGLPIILLCSAFRPT